MTNPDIEEPHQELKEVLLGQLLVVARLDGLTLVNRHKKLHEVDFFLLPLEQRIWTTRWKQAELTGLLIVKLVLSGEEVV